MSDQLIVGRARELAQLRRAIDRAPGAQPNVVLHGDPGVGKTVLLNEGIAYARRQGMRVIGGSGFESEAQLAFAGLHQLFAPIMEYVDRIEPFHQDVLRRVLGLADGPAPDRLAISVASLAAVAAMAEDGPVLIAVEDAHWVDVPTREVMMFILLRLSRWDLRAIFARRPLTASERVTPGINTIEVGPLPDTEAGELLDLLHPGLPPAVRGRVLDDAAGNPLALAELPAALGTDAATPMEMLPSGTSVRTRLEEGFAGRALTLPDEVRAALLVTALDGDGLENTARPVALTAADVLEIERLGLVTRDSTPSGIRFRHPLVRSAITGTASPDELRTAHTRLADRYRTDPERRIWHLAAAAVEPDETVAAEIEAAARAIGVRGGSGLAVAALGKAADLTPDPADTARRLQLAAEYAGESGQMDLAAGLLDRAKQTGSDPGHVLQGQTTRARILLLRDGDLVAARTILGRLPDDGGSALDRALLTRVTTASYLEDPDCWADLERFLATREPDDGDLVRITSEALRPVLPPVAGQAERLRRAFATLSDQAPPGHVAELCRAATWLDTLHEHRAHLHALIDQESGRGAVTHAASGYWFAAHERFLAGQWDEAETAATSGLDLSIRHGLELLAHDLRLALGWIAAGRGDEETAREYSRTVERWAGPREAGLHLTLSARNLALAALSASDYETAYHYCVQVTPPGDFPGDVAYAPWLVLDLVDAAVHTGRVAEAKAHLRAAEDAGAGKRTARLRLHLAAAHAMTADGPDEAVAHFRTALSLPQIERWPFDHARVRLAFGEHHRRNHQPGDARPELRRAADIFARIGATAWQQRAEQELRAAGVTVAPRQHRPAPAAAATGVPGLTAQQLEVAELAASGLTNKEIGERLYLSPRTVSAHLYRIFPKLGITSRAALRDALATVTDAT
ncbi:regulatory LuxR family protein [Actinocorallia herbida]|uniref:Regulatory LuxR family protein n=1 Tax=Actinocorallia herbida TaxID=58109 RepID=A0A3N1CX28_9ACTN|nr:LuxR family transcriptional regulator [Actinocorallia herbida]ROO85859.1 regulatory LuxR family protein [Actinocorallia herbida]